MVSKQLLRTSSLKDTAIVEAPIETKPMESAREGDPMFSTKSQKGKAINLRRLQKPELNNDWGKIDRQLERYLRKYPRKYRRMAGFKCSHRHTS